MWKKLLLATWIFLPNVSYAETITGDSGGEVISYLEHFEKLRDSGERLVIDGECLSACTLFTAVFSRDKVCVTKRAVLGFHMAMIMVDEPNKPTRLIPDTYATSIVMRIYPRFIRYWIEQHGGLKPGQLIYLQGKELESMYPKCR